jgi:hypothetical protein
VGGCDLYLTFLCAALRLLLSLRGPQGKDGKTKPPVKPPKVPAAGKGPTFNPANLTPTALAAALTANGKTEGGGKSSAITGAKRKSQGTGKRSTQGDATAKGTKRKKHD